ARAIMIKVAARNDDSQSPKSSEENDRRPVEEAAVQRKKNLPERRPRPVVRHGNRGCQPMTVDEFPTNELGRKRSNQSTRERADLKQLWSPRDCRRSGGESTLSCGLPAPSSQCVPDRLPKGKRSQSGELPANQRRDPNENPQHQPPPTGS